MNERERLTATGEGMQQLHHYQHGERQHPPTIEVVRALNEAKQKPTQSVNKMDRKKWVPSV